MINTIANNNNDEENCVQESSQGKGSLNRSTNRGVSSLCFRKVKKFAQLLFRLRVFKRDQLGELLVKKNALRFY